MTTADGYLLLTNEFKIYCELILSILGLTIISIIYQLYFKNCKRRVRENIK